MPTPDKSKGDRSRDELLAGEYVLGVLSGDARRKVEERLARDGAFAAIVRRWQDNLLDVEEEITPLPPPIARQIRREMKAMARPARPAASGSRPAGWWWNSLPVWRGLTAISVMTLLMMIAIDTGMME